MADDMFGCSAFYSLNSFAFAIDFDAEQVFDMDIVFVLSGISSLSFFIHDTMTKQQFTELYNDNNPNAARSIRVEIKDGLVTFEQQDIGPLCDEMFGDSDYERVIFDLPVEQLRSVMDVNTDKELISVLKRDYSTEDAFDRFSEFVYDNHLKYNIYCG